MKLKPLILLLTLVSGFLILYSCRVSKENKVVSLQSIEWLNGRWSSSVDGIFENFVPINDNYIERVIYHIEDGQPVVSERGKIFENDASLALTTTIFETKQNEFSKFELLDHNFHKIIFQNLQHDNPFQITMELQPNGKLDITESNRAGKKLRSYELTRQNLP